MQARAGGGDLQEGGAFDEGNDGAAGESGLAVREEAGQHAAGEAGLQHGGPQAAPATQRHAAQPAAHLTCPITVATPPQDRLAEQSGARP